MTAPGRKATKADEQAQVQAQALDVLAVTLAAWHGLPGRPVAIGARWSARVVRHKLDG
jgi:hypothetical protein